MTMVGKITYVIFKKTAEAGNIGLSRRFYKKQIITALMP